MSPRPQPLFGSRALADWIAAGGRPARRLPLLAARLRWHARWFELNWRSTVERLEGLEQPRDPVFILGPWRSGTTVLHELLTACGGWTTPRTWQCFNPSTCFLTKPPARAASADRPMDRGRIETHGPQEDEFALLLLGEPSVYRGLIDPRRLLECGTQLWSGNEGPLGRWRDFLRGVSGVKREATGAKDAPATASAEGARRAAEHGAAVRLLLKSPSHTFRLPLIQKLFPRARFIWIGRRPGEVLASNLRMWRTMMNTYALWECPAGALERFLHDALEACTAVLGRCLAEMPPDRMRWVDYEALQAQPARTLRQALDFIGPAVMGHAGTVDQQIARALAAVPIHPGQRAELPANDTVRELDRVMLAARERFGSGDLRQA